MGCVGHEKKSQKFLREDMWVLWALKNKILTKINWREGLWVAWVIENKNFRKKLDGRPVGGVGNEK